MFKHSIRRPLIFLLLIASLGAGGFAAWQYGVRSLKTLVEQALGPRGELREIRVGLRGVEILDLCVRAPDASWPDKDELRARRILVTPNFFDLLTGGLSIDSIGVEGVYLALLRTKKEDVKIVPGLLDQPRNTADAAKGTGTVSLDIDRITISDGVVEFYDESIRAKPVKLRIEQLEATMGKLRVPELAGPTNLKVDGVVKGSQRDGRLAIEGTIDVATKTYDVTTRLRGVDMTLLQPYLSKASETGIRRGTLDLDLNASVAGDKLRAPGTLTLTGLELSAGSSTFMGVPRKLATGLLENEKGRISLKFVLEGRLDDPRFSLNEHLAARLGSSLTEMLGVKLKSLTRDIGDVGDDPAKAIADSIGRALGRRPGGKR
ncbi:MAG: DUF748 domain-containing protein [Candidatus Accumulibacter sp.]|jgi:uncharacterized protein involved in outer membrane biogenesis|nr:DUF748 domain-containing protein [Accumulibacter sp.]